MRQVEWAQGTDYVWVTDSTLNYIYIVDVVKQEVVNTLKDINISRVLSVQNFDMARQIEMQKQIVHDLTMKDDKTFEIVAIVVGCLALVAGIANFLFMSKMRRNFQMSIGREEPLGLVVNKDLETASASGLNSIN